MSNTTRSILFFQQQRHHHKILKGELKFQKVTVCGSKIYHPKICFFGTRINLAWLFLRNWRVEKFVLVTSPLTAWNNLDKGPVPRIELSPKILVKDMSWLSDGETQQGLESRIYSMSAISAWPNKHFLPPSNMCFSISLQVTLLTFEISKHYLQHLLLF